MARVIDHLRAALLPSLIRVRPATPWPSNGNVSQGNNISTASVVLKLHHRFNLENTFEFRRACKIDGLPYKHCPGGPEA